MDPTAGSAAGLERFLKAQEPVYPTVLDELRDGRKRSHWMWFIFPQLSGLGFSATARHYAIRGKEEAADYLRHPVLGARLRECTQTVLQWEGRSLAAFFGYPDDLKFRSCMTLFAQVAPAGSVFEQALQKLCQGEADTLTLELLKKRSDPIFR